MDDSGPLIHRDLVPRDHTMVDLRPGRELVERAAITQAYELLTPDPLCEVRVRIERHGNPVASVTQAVLGVGLDGGRDVRGQRPRSRRPDDERLVLPFDQREAHVERRVELLAVDVRLRELVLRDGSAAARAPLGGTVPEIEPTLLVHVLEEPPDVFDVGVAEGEVIVAPVHPLAEASRAPRQLGGVAGNGVAALPRELGEAVLLDLALRVQSQRALDADLDPETLAVVAVLITLVESAERVVALEDVLERPAPAGVDAELLVRGDRPVEEAPLRAVAILLPQPVEDPLRLPPGEHLLLEAEVVGILG